MFAGEAIDPRDFASDWFVAQHYHKAFERGHDWAAVHDARSAEQAGSLADKLTGGLKAEAGKSRKQRRTLKQLHADLVVLGFSGSYNRVAAFARDWRFDRQRESQTTGRGTFVPLTFSPWRSVPIRLE